jgi:hypothetical protein
VQVSGVPIIGEMADIVKKHDSCAEFQRIAGQLCPFFSFRHSPFLFFLVSFALSVPSPLLTYSSLLTLIPLC